MIESPSNKGTNFLEISRCKSWKSDWHNCFSCLVLALSLKVVI